MPHIRLKRLRIRRRPPNTRCCRSKRKRQWNQPAKRRWPLPIAADCRREGGAAQASGALLRGLACPASCYRAASPIGTTTEPGAPAARSGITSAAASRAASAAAIRADIRSAAATKAASGRRM